MSLRLPWRSIRWLQRLVHLWLFGYLLSSLTAAEWIWVDPVMPTLPAPTGVASMLTHAFNTWAPPSLAIAAVLLLMVLAWRSVLLPSRWYITLVEWILFSSLVNYAWLTSTGGHQLIANVLFWMIFLPVKERETEERVRVHEVLQVSAFWIIRSQLLVAYLVTGLLKLTGTHWLSGTALGIVATDASYGPAWLASVPVLAMVVNYAVLIFQLTFPIAVWWAPTRHWWMLLGVVFHLVTGFAFGILDMGLAFLAVYPIWSGQAERSSEAPVAVRA